MELAHAPVHVPLGTLRVQVQEVERYDRDPARGELVRDAHVGLLGEAVVGPRQDDHGKLLRVGLKLGQHPPADRFHLGKAVALALQGGGEGRARRRPAHPHAPGRLQQRPLGAGKPAREVHQRRQQPRAAPASRSMVCRKELCR